MRALMTSAMNHSDAQTLSPESVFDALSEAVLVFDNRLTLSAWNHSSTVLLAQYVQPSTDLTLGTLLKQLPAITPLRSPNSFSPQPQRPKSQPPQTLQDMHDSLKAGDVLPSFTGECHLGKGIWLEVTLHPQEDHSFLLSLHNISRFKESLRYLERSAEAMTQQLLEIQHHREFMEEQAAKMVGMAEELAIAQQAAEDTTARLQSTLNTMADGLVTLDMDGHIQTHNHAMKKIFGYNSDELLQSHIQVLISTVSHNGETITDFTDFLQSLPENAQGQSLAGMALRKDDQRFPVELAITELHMGGQKLFTVLMRDVTERYEAEKRIRDMALQDSLTGLANRNLFHRRLEDALKSAKRMGTNVAVLFLDLDKFKPVNDTYGHGVGDELLKVVARRLGFCCREVDTVARLGGDEFAIVLTHIVDPNDIDKVAKRILEALTQSICVEDHNLHVGTSIGVSFFPADADDPDELIRMADVALYQAKDDGRGVYRLYNPAMDTKARDSKAMEEELEHALLNDEFALVYQPQVDAMDGHVIGVEALIRWQHPEKGVIPPLTFIPKAEDTGLILPLGKWVLRTACKQAQRWQAMGLPPMRICVNISARQFEADDFITTVENILAETGLDPQWLELEITEGMVIDKVEQVVKRLQRLSQLGIRLAIDDFGTGYSSLSYLKRFAVHALKIDRSFIRDITEDHDDEAITDAIIRLGHSLGLEIIAEGVETDDHVRLLRQKGCDIFQGFHFSKPLATGEVESWITAYNKERH
ncbi:MAG: hypothetical protein CMF31_07355 [Kordiimonas sp.]|nr:hypothetical protein [Kordiimonas sp.]